MALTKDCKEGSSKRSRLMLDSVSTSNLTARGDFVGATKWCNVSTTLPVSLTVGAKFRGIPTAHRMVNSGEITSHLSSSLDSSEAPTSMLSIFAVFERILVLC